MIGVWRLSLGRYAIGGARDMEWELESLTHSQAKVAIAKLKGSTSTNGSNKVNGKASNKSKRIVTAIVTNRSNVVPSKIALHRSNQRRTFMNNHVFSTGKPGTVAASFTQRFRRNKPRRRSSAPELSGFAKELAIKRVNNNKTPNASRRQVNNKRRISNSNIVRKTKTNTSQQRTSTHKRRMSAPNRNRGRSLLRKKNLASKFRSTAQAKIKKKSRIKSAALSQLRNQQSIYVFCHASVKLMLRFKQCLMHHHRHLCASILCKHRQQLLHKRVTAKLSATINCLNVFAAVAWRVHILADCRVLCCGRTESRLLLAL